MLCKRLFLTIACLPAILCLRTPASAQLWVSHYLVSLGPNDATSGQVTDHAGNVLLTGQVNQGDPNGLNLGNYSYITIKVDGQTGRILWVSHYSELGTGYSAALAIAVDSHNDVFVTGHAYGGAGSKDDYATAKLEGTTGRMLWVRHWDGQGNGNDSANALVVDSQDNVIVTGETDGGVAVGGQITTLKYRGTDGGCYGPLTIPVPTEGQMQAEGSLWIVPITSM